MSTESRRGQTHRSTPFGALLGAGVGFFLGRLPGAVIGGLLGHLFQKQVLSGQPYGDPAAKAVGRAAALVDLAVATARIDGPLDASEREAIHSYFHRDAGLPPDALEHGRPHDKRRHRGPCRSPAAAAGAMPPLDGPDRVHVLFVLFRIALADRFLAPAESAALAEVAGVLGLTTADFQGIQAHFVAQNGTGFAAADDYAILGLEPGADADLVRRRYREAVKNYHPDRFQHLGDEFTSVASEKFKRIQEAYDRITDRSAPGPQPVRLSVCTACRVFSPVESASCPRCGAPKYEQREGQVRIRCPFCTQTNGLPRLALESQVRCGNCKVLLVR